MSKVITFSRVFPATHPKAGQPTYFVEKIWKCLWDAEKSNHNPLDGYFQYYDQAFPCTHDPLESIHKHEPKYHTIRAGNRWKAGDKFSPRVWSGRPYNSKQIVIGPDIEVKKVWDFKITTEDDDGEHDWSFVTFLDKHYTCYGYGGYDDVLMLDNTKKLWAFN